jgi:dihydrodipicolinate synthase/N-acetylneuraminate lyase
LSSPASAPRLAGVLPVLPTPFAADGAIDIAAMERVVDFAIACGAHGFVFPGVASEFNFLSLDERRSLIAVVGKALGGRPFVVGGSAETVEDVVRLCADGTEHGATAAMVMAPAKVGSEPSALIDFYGEIGRRTGLDIVLQNAPAPVGSGLPVDTIAKVAAAVPAITYVKEETLPPGPRISGLIGAAPPHLKGVIGGGGARHLYDELDRGAIAAMPAVEITDLHVALYEAFIGGDRDKARALYIRSLPMLLVQLTYRMRLTKEVLVRRGVIAHAGVRAPLPEFDAKGLEELDMMLAELADLLTGSGTARVEAAQ